MPHNLLANLGGSTSHAYYRITTVDVDGEIYSFAVPAIISTTDETATSVQEKNMG